MLALTGLGHRRVDDVQRQRGTGSEHQRGQGGHRRGENQNDDDADHQVRQRSQHRRDDTVVNRGAGRRVLDVLAIKPAETAQEVAAARHDDGEEGGDERALADGRFVSDRVELAHHLRQSPGAQGGQHHHTQQVDGLRSKEGDEGAVQVGSGIGRNLREAFHRRGESPVSIEHGRDDGADAHQHDQALDEVVHGRRHVTAHDHIDAGENGHAQHAPDIIHVEGHAEES